MNVPKVIKSQAICKGRYIRTFDNGDIDIVDKKQKVVIPPLYSDIKSISGHFIVSRKGVKGICSISGEQILSCAYEDIYVFDWNNVGRYFTVKKSGKYGLFDAKSRNLILECVAEKISPRTVKYKGKYEAVAIIPRKILGFIPWFPAYHIMQLQK